MTCRLVVFDIDGTLLGSDGQPQPGTRRALTALREAGVRIMLASGRPVMGLRALADRLDLGRGLMLAGLNGAEVEEQDTGRVITRHPMPMQTAQRIVDATVSHGLVAMAHIGRTLCASAPEHLNVEAEAALNRLEIRPLPAIEDLPEAPSKLLLSGQAGPLRELARHLEGRFAGEAEFAFSAPTYYEATAPGVDKGAAVRGFCAAEGIDLAEVIAFGDHGNDVPMLRAAGLGVAMGNAAPAAREAADVVTSTNDDEGILRILEQHVSIPD